MAGGFGCCCCFRVAPCLHCDYCSTPDFWVKMVQLLLCIICQLLAMNSGIPYSAILGASFSVFLTTCSAGILTTAVLIITYTISPTSRSLVRSSVLEVVFHSVSCFMYLASSLYLSYTVQTYLWPLYMNLSPHSAYLPMCICYILGGVLSILHGVEVVRTSKQRITQR